MLRFAPVTLPSKNFPFPSLVFRCSGRGVLYEVKFLSREEVLEKIIRIILVIIRKRFSGRVVDPWQVFLVGSSTR